MRSSAIVSGALVEMKHNGQKFNKEYFWSTSSLPLYSQSTRKRSKSSIKSERGVEVAELISLRVSHIRLDVSFCPDS